jgi:predicted nucleic acid-binding protein
MSAVLVDSNVLLDVIGQDPNWLDWSSRALAEAADSSRVVINPIIFAEVSMRYTRIEDLDQALPRALVDREPIPYEAAFLAGKVFLAYRRRGGEKLLPLPDFFIGAHAAVSGYRLLTRDPRRYRSNFSGLSLITPDGPTTERT